MRDEGDNVFNSEDEEEYVIKLPDFEPGGDSVEKAFDEFLKKKKPWLEPPGEKRNKFSPRHSGQFRKIGLYLLAFGFLFIGAVLCITGLVKGAPLDKFHALLFSLVFTLPAFALFSLLVIRVFHLNLKKHKVVRRISPWIFLSFVIGGWGLVMLFNATWDARPAKPHKALVVKKKHLASYSPYSIIDEYYVLVKSWRPGRKTEKVVVGSSIYSRITPQKTELVLAVKPGRFGFEWISSYKIF